MFSQLERVMFSEESNPAATKKSSKKNNNDKRTIFKTQIHDMCKTKAYIIYILTNFFTGHVMRPDESTLHVKLVCVIWLFAIKEYTVTK